MGSSSSTTINDDTAETSQGHASRESWGSYALCMREPRHVFNGKSVSCGRRSAAALLLALEALSDKAFVQASHVNVRIRHGVMGRSLLTP